MYAYFENHRKPINKLCGQNAGILILKYVVPTVTEVL
jgi:hypothetical protein